MRARAHDTTLIYLFAQKAFAWGRKEDKKWLGDENKYLVELWNL